MAKTPSKAKLPTGEQIGQAVEEYISLAYGGDPPEKIKSLLPRDNCHPESYLMGDKVERDRPAAGIDEVRSFTLRLGNPVYPNMKLRISRVPKGSSFVFSVDSHDAFLQAPPGSSDAELLRQVKDHNAGLARKIESAWDAAGLPTQKAYLRRKIRQARRDR